MKGERLQFSRTWLVGDAIGSGGFGQVFVVSSGDEEAVAKFVAKAPGADRELLFVSLTGIRNVVPVFETGDHGDSWVLVMPRAELSLRDFLDQRNSLTVEECVVILKDITDALVDLEGTVVHRDLKPENIRRLHAHWCLSDFGISRYADASTAPDTRRFALSPYYAAPERWRNEHARSAADMYSLGVIGYELLTGQRPFAEGSIEDLREAHLHENVPPLEGAPIALATLIEECLFKAPQTRPSPANFRARVDRYEARTKSSAGLARLQEANHADVQHRVDVDRQASQARSEAGRRATIRESATSSLGRIASQLRKEIVGSAPAVQQTQLPAEGWELRLSAGTLSFAVNRGGDMSWDGWSAPPFDVVDAAWITLTLPADRFGYEGRSHALWYGDIQQLGQYRWYETAFMFSPLIARQSKQAPSF